MSGKPGPALTPQRDVTWRNYIERSAGGDQSALAQLYDESSPLVYSLALRMLGDAADAEEVTMDVYTQVWRTAARYDDARGSPMAWLVTLTRSRAIDRARSRAGRTEREEPILDFSLVREERESPEAAAETGQRRKRVQAALTKLSPEQREAIHLAFFSGLTHSELARRLGQPLGTVKTRIRSAMMKLREQLEADRL